MLRLRVLALLGLVAAALLTGCGSAAEESAQRGRSSAESEGRPGENGDVRWGEGEYGVVLAHGAAFDAASWSQQATRIADLGASVIAVQDIAPESIAEAVSTLKSEGHERVALVGGSAGSDAILQLSAEQPELADQLVLLSPNSAVDGLGRQPKLFIASEEEPVADVSTELARSAPGDDNEVILLPGSAHAQNIFDSAQGPRAQRALLDRIADRVG
ncbi:alpha/beta fold hydrolase [Marmoricola endophyticus]|uniref:alpha/beta fold hydrolase n=1 Tax=Marmoricola endophyticus TaxID=2040280 RepID=UPI001E428948|nr:hypothetical protein [Marmoricola endophyticus]